MWLSEPGFEDQAVPDFQIDPVGHHFPIIREDNFVFAGDEVDQIVVSDDLFGPTFGQAEEIGNIAFVHVVLSGSIFANH